MTKEEQKIIEGLNKICNEGGDEYKALCKLLGKRVTIKDNQYNFLDIINKALETNIRPETPGSGDNSLLGFA